MRTVTNVAWLAGPLVLLGYLAGSVPFAFVLRRRGLRQALDRLDEGSLDPSAPADPERVRWADVAGPTLEALAALAAVGVTWWAIRQVAPGGGGGSNASAVAVLSAQALTVWQSAALWTGYAAVIGHLAPVWLRFRGGTGLPPVLALSALFLPLVFSASVACFFAGYLVWRTVARGVLAAAAGAVTFEWLAWVYDWPPAWGLRNGAEVAVWVTVVAVALVGRWGRAALDGADGPAGAGGGPAQPRP